MILNRQSARRSLFLLKYSECQSTLFFFIHHCMIISL
jgi:hypothetical protein